MGGYYCHVWPLSVGLWAALPTAARLWPQVSVSGPFFFESADADFAHFVGEDGPIEAHRGVLCG
jgi:hypothetical protein